ncbi:MAG: putative metal-dependent hydrolase [Osedax symbiont Rs1]|nr:MAG: putative metal-dependent hydrolase [Osedax symbiont Rs1]
MKKDPFYYISGYPAVIKEQVSQLLDSAQLGRYLLNKYPHCHQLGAEKQLYKFAIGLKNQHLKKSPPLSKVVYDDKIDTINNALGLHAQIARIQGNKLKAKREIKIAAVFKRAPIEFLKMIVVHELAHLKEKDHNRAFYNLCCYMQADYYQVELDLRLYLTHLQQLGELYPKSHLS